MKVEGKVIGSVRLERFVKERRATKNLEDREIHDLFLDTQFDEYQRWWGKLDYENKTYEVNTFFKKGDGPDHLPEGRVWSTGARLSPWQLEIRLPISRKQIGEYLEKEGEDPTSARVRQVECEIRAEINLMIKEMFGVGEEPGESEGPC